MQITTHQNVHKIWTWILLYIALTSLAHCARVFNTNPQPQTLRTLQEDMINTLQLNSSKVIDLQAGKPKQYTVEIKPQTISEEEVLYIEAQSLYRDRFQSPSITINSKPNLCERDANGYLVVCKIERSQILQSPLNTIEATCEVNCSIKLSVYSSALLSRSIGSEFTLVNSSPVSTIKNIKFTVPSNNFTQISILATTVYRPSTKPNPNPDQNQNTPAQEPTIIVGNYGVEAKVATLDNFMVKAQSTSSDSLGIYLSKRELGENGIIILSIVLGPWSEVKIVSGYRNQNGMVVSVGKGFYDYNVQQEKKIYQVDFGGQKVEGDVYVKFIVYSGRPELTVSFDKDFTNVIDKVDNQASFLYEIPIDSESFEGTIYLKITSLWSSNYYIQTFINKKPFLAIEAQIPQLLKLKKGQLKNLIFIDETPQDSLPEQGPIEYIITTSNPANRMKLYLGTCTTPLPQCLIPSPSSLPSNLSLLTPTPQKFEGQSFIFTKDVKKQCPQENGKRVCKFLIVAEVVGDQDLNSSIEITKNILSTILKEGENAKGYVAAGRENFYRFYLPTIKDVMHLQFFINVRQGDAGIMVSRSVKFPRLQYYDQGDKIQLAPEGHLEIQADRLQVGNYYLSVHGYESTQYTIGVAIHRKNGQQSSVTQIQLIKGVTQTFTIPMGSTRADFVFTVDKENQKSVIVVTDFQGNVEFVVFDKQSPETKITGNTRQSQLSTELKLKTQASHSYKIQILSQPTQTQMFTILYTQQSTCSLPPWNFPLAIKLHQQQTLCYKFTFLQIQPIHISLDLSVLQIFQERIEIYLNFGGGSLDVSDSDRIVTKEELEILCKGQTDNGESCSFEVRVVNINGKIEQEKENNLEDHPELGDVEKEVNFIMAVQKFSKENLLFNGITSKIYVDKAGSQRPQKFYYYLHEKSFSNDTLIAIAAKTESKYRISAKLVKAIDHNMDSDSQLYPTQTDTTSIFSSSSTSSPLTVLRIPHQNITSFSPTTSPSDKSLVLLICVFVQGQTNFDIQVSQAQQSLQLGDSLLGYIEKNQIYTYQFTLQKMPTTIEIRDLDQSQSLNQCAITYLHNPSKNQTIQFPRIISFINQIGTRILTVKTSHQLCNYQVTFKAVEVGVVEVLPMTFYPIYTEIQTHFLYIYRHNSPEGFYVLQMVNTGGGYLRVRRFAKGQTITQVLSNQEKIQKQQFEFVGDLNSNVEVSNTSKNFCKDCYYLICVVVEMSLDAEIVVNLKSVPIPLKNNVIMKDNADKGIQNVYQLFSRVTFSLYVNVIYGQINVTIYDPKNNVIYTGNVKVDADINVEVPNDVVITGESDYRNPNARFIVKINANEQSSYFINMEKKERNFTQLFEGIQKKLNVTDQSENILLFTSKKSEGEFVILIEDVNFKQQPQGAETFKNSNLSFVIREQGKTENLITHSSQSLGSHSITALRKQGKFQLLITTNLSTELSIILLKKQYNHLSPGRSYIMTTPSNFQIFSPNTSILIELYTCQGSLQLQATRNYSLISSNNTQSSLARMQHGNYGSHYVVTASNLSGQYFLKVSLDQTIPSFSSTSQKPIKYIVSYYLLGEGEGNPYKEYFIQGQGIRYRYVEGGVRFGVGGVMRKDGTIAGEEVVYNFYISVNKQQVEQAARCSIVQSSTMYNFTKKVKAGQQSQIFFQFTTDHIKKMINNAQNYTVGAQATITFLNAKDSPTSLHQANFIYETTVLAFSNSNIIAIDIKLQQLRTFALWIAIPFLIGSILVFLAIRFLIRSYRRAYPTQLVEQDGEAHVGSETPVAGGSNSAF